MIKVLTLNDRICAHRDNAGHATEVPPNARLLFLNGQVGARIEGTVPDDVGEQVEISFERIQAILDAADMGFQDIVKLTVYFTDAAHLDHFYRIRPRHMGEHNPPVVLLTVGPFPRLGACPSSGGFTGWSWQGGDFGGTHHGIRLPLRA